MNENESASNYTKENNFDSSNTIDANINHIQSPMGEGTTLLSILKSPTGQGTIDSYNDHPLNFKNNHFLSQILRGLSGIIGTLDFAVIDIILGTIGFFKGASDV
jgi:hypothetical protein